MQRATLKDVALRAEVHVATASRALNESTQHMVRTDTLDRVLGAANELGYTTNMTARTLRTACSRAVGMLIPDLTTPIFPPMVRGVEEVLRGLGYSTWVANTDEDPVRGEEAISAFRQRNVDGFILATARMHEPIVEQMLDQRSPTPIVLANRRPARSDIQSVGVDEAGVIRIALDHLVGLGHRRITMLAGPQDVSTGLVSRRAFESYVDEYDLPTFPGQVGACDTDSVVAGREAMRAALAGTPPFTAVLAGNDLIALGCFDALRDAGLRCPQDVSVIGVNDMLMMDRITPALTTVAIPHQDIGAHAARLLVEAMRHSLPREASVLLTPSLTVRESTAPPATFRPPPTGPPVPLSDRRSGPAVRELP